MKFYRYRRFNSEDVIYTYKENGTEKIFNENPVTAELKNGVVVFSYPTEFNDPYDCALVFYSKDLEKFLNENRNVLVNLINGRLKDGKRGNCFDFRTNVKSLTKREKNELTHAEDYKMYVDRILKVRGIDNNLFNVNADLRKTVKVACFTPFNNIILMWSHYADSHKGYCIEYEIPENDKRVQLHKVLYSENLPDVTKAINRINDCPIIEIACTKDKNWEYENEYRAVMLKNQICNTEITEKISEYLDFKQYITAVYIGAEASIENVNRVIKIAKEENFKVYQMQKSATEYNLIPNELHI